MQQNHKLHLYSAYIIIIGSVFSDLLNGFLNQYVGIAFPVGVLFRMGVILYALYYFLLSSYCQGYKLYLILIFLIWGFDNFYWILTSSAYSFGAEISDLLKIYYPLLLGYYFSFCLFRGYIKFKTLIIYCRDGAFIASLFIVFSYLSGIGLHTYGDDYGFGTSSFFDAQNDLSLALLLGLCFAFYLFFTDGKKKINFAKLIFIVFGLSLIGTRAGTIGGGIIIIGFIAYSAIKGNHMYFTLSKMGRRLFGLFIFLATILAGVFVYNNIMNDNYMIQKYETLSATSPREVLKGAAYHYIGRRTPFQQFFGQGSIQYRRALYGILHNGVIGINSNAEKSAEMDFVDLVGAYGIVFALIVYLFPILVLISFCRYFLRDKKKPLLYTLAFCMIIFVGHSLIAGHGMKNPSVGTLLGMIYAYFLISKKNSARTLPI